jgi:hypothetical protein
MVRSVGFLVGREVVLPDQAKTDKLLIGRFITGGYLVGEQQLQAA